MDELQEKVKQWIDAITKEKMSGVADELEETLGTQITEKTNKLIFKLLMYLSHAANKCDKSKSKLGLEISRIGSFVCSKMTVIPDAKKFFSSIYHIASCLIEMGLYKEALEICEYLLPGRLWQNVSPDCADMYSKVAQLLHNAALTMLKKSKLSIRKNYDIFITVVKYELDVTKLAYESCSRHILTKILTYIEKLGAITDKSEQSAKEEFTDTMLTYIRGARISLDDQNNEYTYRVIFSIITELLVKNVNKAGIESIGDIMIRYFDVFRPCLQDHTWHLRCFDLYERLSRTLVKPLKNLQANFVQEITACACELRKILISYGYGVAVKWFSYTIVVLISEVLVYWDEGSKSDKVQYLTHDIIMSTMGFVKEQASVFECYEVGKCRCDNSTKCNIRYDIFNNVALRLKAVAVLSRILVSNIGIVTEEMSDSAVSLVEECLAGISEIKETECTRWQFLWKVCGAHVYNMALSCDPKFVKKSVELYSLLCLNVVKIEGKEVALGKKASSLNLYDPLSSTLHRLTSLHFHNKNYEEATIVCCLNGLINSKVRKLADKNNEVKAFNFWANIQVKYPESRGTTMMECFRLNKAEIGKIIDIHLEDYDRVQLCFRQIKGLAKMKIDLSTSIIRLLDELEKLDAPAAIYAQGVQLLGYHMLNFQSELSIFEYLRKARLNYERERQPSISFQWCYAHIKFHEFRQKLRDTIRKTEDEMKSTTFALSSTKSTNHESGASAAESDNIVPAYSTINMTITKEIATSLEHALNTWKRAITANKNYKDVLENWEIAHSLEVLTVAGECAHFYHLESLELEAWKLAHNLARELQDHRAIVYVTSRRLSSQHVDRKWIEEADKSVKILETSTEVAVKETITAYQLSLAQLYYQNDSPELAKQLYLLATPKLDENFMSDVSNYLLSAHIKMNLCALDKESDDHMQYSRIIVQILYAMLSLEDALEAPNVGWRKQLYCCDQLIESTTNLAPRMNSLVSYREITAHLIRRLEKAQKMAAALRVAECLKSLCYIDLTRYKLDDCEVKLQALEHILEIEGFGLTMRSKMPSTVTSEPFLSPTSCRFEAVRDVQQNNTSPVLRNKVFEIPDFVSHGDICRCFKCANSHYQSLAFASTHLRAQLFSLRRNADAAIDHFEGGFRIKKSMLSRAFHANQHAMKNKNNNSAILQSHRHLDVVEFIVFHLDYCRFLKWSAPERIHQGIAVVHNALVLCELHRLRNHPVFVLTNVLIFEYQYERSHGKEQFSKFAVPAIDEIDISSYTCERPEDPTTCVTPAREAVVQKAVTVRRKKVPFLKLEKVPIDLTEEEPPITTSPPARTRPIRRRNFTDAQKDASDPESVSDRKKSIVPKIKLPIDDEEASSVVIAKTSRKSNKTPVEEVTELLGDLTVINAQPCSSNAEVNFAKTKESVITVPSDEALSSSDEIAVESKRSSLRLRKKSQDASSNVRKNKSQDSNQSAPNSDDEVVIIETKSRRRVASASDQTTTAKESSKSSRSRGNSKRST